MKGHKYKNSVLYRKLHSSRAWVCISVLLALVVDITVLTITLISGIFNEHTLVVSALTILDIALLIAVSKTNFRFTYGRVFPIVYVCINVAAYALLLFVFSQGLFSTTALILFLGVHILSVASLILCMLDASKRGKKVKAVALGILAAFTAGSAFFVNYSVDSGVFGQGTGYKALYYEYDETTDGYAVTGVTSGFGTDILIPETFNDKKVVSVNAEVFSDLENAILECGSTTTFYNVENAVLNTDLVIHTKKANVDHFKAAFVKDVENAKNNKDNFALLANSVMPDDLAKDEVFVSFKYKTDQIIDTNNTLLKTWYGKKGDEFDLKAHAAEHEYEVKYAAGYDPTDEAYLYNCYENNGHRALMALSIDKQKIEESVCVELVFEDVYEITVGETNDKKATLKTEVLSYNNTGKRYVAKSDTYKLLHEFNRTGFETAWEYTAQYTSKRKAFTELSDLFTSWDTNYTIYPVWTLDTPTIEKIEPSKEEGYVYGDTLQLTPTVGAHDLADVEYTYSWSCPDMSVELLDQETADLIINKVQPQESEYVLTITARSPSTELTAESEPMTCGVSVAKKPIDVVWDIPQGTELVYDNTDKTVSCALNPEKVVSGDEIETNWTDLSVRDANDYAYSVSLTGGFEDLYELQNDYTSFTIRQRKIEVLWETPDFTYDGDSHEPAYTLGGENLIPEDGATVQVSGGAQTAGTHTMFASVSSNNYTISVGATYSYQIAPKDVTVIWDSEVDFTYDGNGHAPSASLEGVYSFDSLDVAVDGYQTNARDEAYTATARLYDDGYTANNYTIAQNPTQEFTIARKVIDISWGGTALTYNGENQAPSVWANDTCYGDIVNVVVTGAQKNVGYSHTATATGFDNTNYELAAVEEMPFTISPKQISVSWSNTSLTYNGSEQRPTATANGVCSGDSVNLTLEGGETNAGSGYLVQVTGQDNTNYELSGTLSASFSIAQKGITINWSNVNLTYNATAQKPTATPNGVCAGDTLPVNVSGEGTNAGSYTATATISDDNYYISSGSTKAFSIAKKTLSLTWSNGSFTYNATAQKPTATIAGGVCEGDSVIVTVSGAGTNAGSYTATASLSDETNYAISTSTQSKTFSIGKKSLSLTWSNDSFTYNATAQKPTASITSGVCEGDSVIVTVSGAQTNAGTYTATASINNANYSLSSNSKSFTIAKKTITFTFNAGSAFDYTGSPIKMEGTYSGGINGDGVTVTYKYYSNGAQISGAPTKAGTYEVRVELSSAFKTNYTLSGTTTKTFTIRSVSSAA